MVGGGWAPACSAATTKISPRAVSMTGVEVIPTVGSMLPQIPGTVEGVKGVATWVDHSTAPVSAARA